MSGGVGKRGTRPASWPMHGGRRYRPGLHSQPEELPGWLFGVIVVALVAGSLLWDLFR